MSFIIKAPHDNSYIISNWKQCIVGRAKYLLCPFCVVNYNAVSLPKQKVYSFQLEQLVSVTVHFWSTLVKALVFDTGFHKMVFKIYIESHISVVENICLYIFMIRRLFKDNPPVNILHLCI